MSTINYDYLSDLEKFDLLRLLYHNLKNAFDAKAIEQKELIVQETQRVYSRIKAKNH